MLTMKTTTASLFLLFIFTITQSSLVTNATNEPVLDVDGEELRTGVEYYVMPSIMGVGDGGLALGKPPRGKQCPESVVQRGYLDNGIPVIFSNADGHQGVVRESTDLYIEFVPQRPRSCRTSTVWKLDEYDEYTGKRWVTTDGVKGNKASWFKIENGESGYKFKHCPTVCESCKPLICSDIGKELDYSVFQIRLAVSLSDESLPSPWVFKRVEESQKNSAERSARARIRQVVKA